MSHSYGFSPTNTNINNSRTGVEAVKCCRLTSVDPEMSLEFEGVRAGIGTVGALVGPLSTVTPHVPLELAQLHRHVVTVRALVGLLVGVAIPHVPHQLPAGGEARLAVLASVWLGARVSVDVVLQAGQGLEASLTD